MDKQMFVAYHVALASKADMDAKRWVTALLKAGEAFIAGGKAEADAFDRMALYDTTPEACQCDAGKHGFPCKHRAFAHLVLRSK